MTVLLNNTKTHNPINMVMPVILFPRVCNNPGCLYLIKPVMADSSLIAIMIMI